MTTMKSVSASQVRPASYKIQQPFPLVFKDVPITMGFGRGSTELGVPTANVPIDSTLSSLNTGVYYGWCRILPQTSSQTCFKESTLHKRKLEFNYGNKLNPSTDLKILPMVMSIGWNPTYDDLKEKAVEIHILHSFDDTFYGAHLNYSILGFLRPELEFIDLETLKAEINQDIEITHSLLQKQDAIELKNLVE